VLTFAESLLKHLEVLYYTYCVAQFWQPCVGQFGPRLYRRWFW